MKWRIVYMTSYLVVRLSLIVDRGLNAGEGKEDLFSRRRLVSGEVLTWTEISMGWGMRGTEPNATLSPSE